MIIYTEKLLHLLNEFRFKLSLFDFENVESYAKAGEWDLGLELLCTQLYEYSTPLTAEEYKKIAAYGELLKMPPSTWDYLKELIISENKTP